MLADQDGVAVLEHGSFDANIVQKRSVKTVQVLDHQRSGFHVHPCVVIGNGQIIDGNVVVRGAANGYRTRSERNLFQLRALEFQDESRHGWSPPAEAGKTLSGV